MSALNADSGESLIQLALVDPKLHRALLDELDEGVSMVDRDHRILYWNRGAERISGYFAHEVAGQFSHGDLLMHCQDDGSLQPGAGSAAAEVMLDGRQRESTVLLQHREGHRLLVQLQSRPIHDAEGMVVGALEVFEEVVAPLVHRRHQLEAFGCSDSSTCSANRKYGEMLAGQALEAFHVFEIPFGWLRIGLDGAEELDRGYGHGMVNAAVKMIAAALDRSLASLDVLTRWEAVEFRAEVNGCSRLELAVMAERMRLLVKASAVEWWGDRLRVTISVGGASVEPGDTIASLEGRVAQVYEGCLASGGDRSAVAHLTGTGADRCLP